MVKCNRLILIVLGQLVYMGKSQKEVDISDAGQPESEAPLAVGEKNCADYGSSVGHLEWRVWRRGTDIVARCALRDPAHGLKYAIYWTRAMESETERVVHECQDPKLMPKADGSLECEFRPLDVGAGHLVCFIKTHKRKDSGSRTRCSSDEIFFDFEDQPYKRQWKRKAITNTSITLPPFRDNITVRVATASRYIRPQRAHPDPNQMTWLPLEREEEGTPPGVLPLERHVDAGTVATRPVRYRPKLRELPDNEVTSEPDPTTDPADLHTNTDAVDEGLDLEYNIAPPPATVSATVNPFTQAPLEGYESETVTPPPLRMRGKQRYVALQITATIPADVANETVTQEPPKPDMLNVEGWHLRLVLVGVSMVALLVAGSTIGTTLALKFHNRGRDCCDAECCQPCGGRMDRR